MPEKNYNDINAKAISDHLSYAISLANALNYRLEEKELYEEIRILNEQVKSCYRALAELQNSIEISQYDAGKVEPISFNLSRHIEHLVSTIRSRMISSTIEIIDSIEKGVMCYANPDRLSSCVINLIINALQNVDREEGKVRIIVKRSSDSAVVSVIDNGYAMSSERLSRILAQEDGMHGLDICKRFCRLVGTEPMFETRENSGFTVIVRIPLAPPEDKLKFNSDMVYMKSGSMSPCTILLYKLEEASVVL